MTSSLDVAKSKSNSKGYPGDIIKSRYHFFASSNSSFVIVFFSIRVGQVKLILTIITQSH